MTTHNAKLIQLKEQFEAEGYICRKNNYPVFLPDEERFSLIDIVCFKGKEPPIAIELESKNTQQLRNLKGLEEFKKIFPKSQTCQIFVDDDLNKCDLGG